MTHRFRTLALTSAVAASLIAAPAAGADQIDDALAALPSGPISCEQASRYWTNDADYNNRVRQARAIAMFDSRGPQILDALGRVDEAANRCGLKGTTGGKAPAQQAPSQPSRPAPSQPAPAQPAPAPQGQLYVLAPQGVPTFDVPVAGVATVRLPDLGKILQDLIAKNGGSSLPNFPA